MRRAISVFGAFLLALTFAMAAFAQDSGRVNGEILDKDGKPYADVTVSMKNQDTGQVYTIKTDKNGKFVQLGMRGGIYDRDLHQRERRLQLLGKNGDQPR